MKSFFFWEGAGIHSKRVNPYAALLSVELEKLGIYMSEGDYQFTNDWLKQHQDEFKVLHFNWLDRFYARFNEPKNNHFALSRFKQFKENFLYAKTLGYKTIWTVHNLFPHERLYPDIDIEINNFVAQKSDYIITHCKFAATQISNLYNPKCPIKTIPHGSFRTIFPNTISRLEARKILGISNFRFLYLFFGNARGYKGIINLVNEFISLRTDDSSLLLVLRKNERSPSLIRNIQKLVENHENIILISSSYFETNQFQIYLNACDFVVLPFSAVLSSGTAIQALDFGKPLIIPKLGCLPELVNKNCGILFDPDKPEELADALVKARNVDLQKASSSALKISKKLDWGSIAKRISSLYYN